MRLRIAPFAATIAVVALVVMIVKFAQSGASGAPADRSVAVTHDDGAALIPRSTLRSCEVVPARQDVIAALELNGACSGPLESRAACITSDESLSASLHGKLTNGRDLYLTLVVPESSGVGSDDAKLFAQVTGAADVHRWSNRSFSIAASSDSTLHLDSIVLRSERGTPTFGQLEVSGTVSCVHGSRQQAPSH